MKRLAEGRSCLLLVAVAALALVVLGLPVQAQWASTGSMNTPRCVYTATLLPDGKVLVAGGSISSGWASSAELYDLATGTWTATGSMAHARTSHTATLLQDGRVLVAGGQTEGFAALSSCEIYDPASGTWSETGSMIAGRWFHTATLLPSGKVLVAAGLIDGIQTTNEEAEIYDPASGSWSVTGPMAESAPRGNHVASLAGGKVLIAGGGSSNGPVATAELYDPASDTWTLAHSMLTPRIWHHAVLLQSGKVLVMGGQTGGGTPSDLSSAELYDPATDSWSATGSMSLARIQFTATLLSNGDVFVAGGDDGSQTFPPASEIYVPDTGMWLSSGSMALGRVQATATLLASGQVLVAGGSGKYSIYPNAEIYTYAPPVANPPVIALIKKVGPPFQLAVKGSNLQDGILVKINGTLLGPSSVKWMNSGKIKITGGNTLKALVPKSTPTDFIFYNPDGGTATVTGWSW